MSKIKLIVVSLFLTAAAFASDCDIPFSLTTANPTQQWNNKNKACANWQVSYFSAGYSAVSFQFESAPDNGNSPGTWVAFAGTTVTGSNPATATTQATGTFSGVYPWVRVRLVSSTGTGQVTGRILGVQLTSAAVGFATVPFSYFGNFVPPVLANFTPYAVDFGTSFTTAPAAGLSFALWDNKQGGRIRRKECVTLHAAPFSLTIAVRMPAIVPNQGNLNGGGMSLLETSTNHEETFGLYYGVDMPFITTPFYCTTNDFSACTARGPTTVDPMGGRLTVQWLRVVDNGTTRVYQISENGENWVDMGFPTWGVVTAGANYNAIVPNRACLYVDGTNGNFMTGVELLSWSIV